MMDNQENSRFDFEKYKSLVRYVIVGGINTGVDFLTFLLLHTLFAVNLGVSQAAGYCAGILNSFLLNKFWTFENKTSPRKTTSQAVKFVAVNVATLGISVYGLQVLAGNWGLHILAAKGMITLLTMVLNYLGYKLWVFRDAN